MNGRLVLLYLQSRRTWAAAVMLIVIAAIAWLSLDRSRNPVLTDFLLMIMPVGAAVVIGVVTLSPFGETERTASRSLPVLRLSHLSGLLLCAAFTLALANRAEPSSATAWALVRNGAGYAGLALLGARMLGGTSWVVPVGYGLAVWVAVSTGFSPDDTWWVWPAEDAFDGSAWASALGLLLLGLLAIVPAGARETPDEAE